MSKKTAAAQEAPAPEASGLLDGAGAQPATVATEPATDDPAEQLLGNPSEPPVVIPAQPPEPPAPQPPTRARLLVARGGYEAGSLVDGTAEQIEQLVSAGEADAHPDAVAYAVGQRAPVLTLGE